MEKIRVGLIGAGGIANAHIQGYQAADNVEVVAVWNRTKERAAELVASQSLDGAIVYDDWESMLNDADLDMVSVVTAPQLRKEPVLMAIDRGMHVLVEKPFASNMEDAEEMCAAADESPCICSVCFTWRYKPAVLAARKLILSREIGDITNCDTSWHMSWPTELMTPAFRPFMTEGQGGLGMIGENGSHQFDMITFLTGETVKSMCGNIDWMAPADGYTRSNYAYHFVAKSPQNIPLTINHTMPPGPAFMATRRQIYIEGTKGSIMIDGGILDDGKVTALFDGSEQINPISPSDDDVAIPRTHEGLIADFIAEIGDIGDGGARKSRMPTFSDGMRSLEIVLAGLRADREHQWITLGD